jgi:MFS transporter, NNP family, nitrate/nitrite transporter
LFQFCFCDFFILQANELLGEEAAKVAQAAAAASAVSGGYLLIGAMIVVSGIITLIIRFSLEDEKVAKTELEQLTPELIRIED